MQRKVAFKEMLAYSKAGGAAEEALAAVRIVAAYAGEEKEVKRLVVACVSWWLLITFSEGSA